MNKINIIILIIIPFVWLIIEKIQKAEFNVELDGQFDYATLIAAILTLGAYLYHLYRDKQNKIDNQDLKNQMNEQISSEIFYFINKVDNLLDELISKKNSYKYSELKFTTILLHNIDNLDTTTKNYLIYELVHHFGKTNIKHIELFIEHVMFKNNDYYIRLGGINISEQFSKMYSTLEIITNLQNDNYKNENEYIKMKILKLYSVFFDAYIKTVRLLYVRHKKYNILVYKKILESEGMTRTKINESNIKIENKLKDILKKFPIYIND